MRPTVVLAVLFPVLVCFAIMFLRRSGKSDGNEQNYDLGSGQMFDAIAPGYDSINKVISLGLDMQWRRTMIEGLKLRPGDRVVDMATGTADVAIMISQELEKMRADPVDEETSRGEPDIVAGTVLGIDPSAKMLDIGRTKTTEAGLNSVLTLQIGDAQDLAEISDGSVDKLNNLEKKPILIAVALRLSGMAPLTMAFGIRNVPDRSKALREFRRIMATDSPSTEGKTKGDPDTDGDNEKGSSVVAILELQNPESGVVAAVSRAFIRYAAPILGWMISGSGMEYGHLKDSILNFPSVSEWTQLMEEAGLDVFTHQTMGFGAVHLYLATPRIDSVGA